ncbi:MAG TPA: CDP-alcohol phosphatidyltransferase family protein [Fermentimonas sp.]|nr:CDP-alcohol phosphatidyltransferase family protein [Fermentimonas sp.]
MLRKQIPNIITLLNLFAGTIAITHAFSANFTGVVIWVTIAAIFDFLDGLAARLLKAYSSLGRELDSLADVVSFGVAPASALYILIRDYFTFPEILQQFSQFIPYLAFIIPVFAAYRLAKFNIDERQSTSFLGLPTPANGLFWISYCYALNKSAQIYNISQISNTPNSNHLSQLYKGTTFNINITFITIAAIIIMSLLMVSEIPMFSLKLQNKGIKGNERQIILIILLITLISIFGIAGVAIGIVAYILISILAPINQESVK